MLVANELLKPLGLCRLAPVHEEDSDRDEDEEDGASSDTTNSFGRESVRLDDFVAQVSDGEA